MSDGPATMIETDNLLVKCPSCGAWPMAANLLRPASVQPEIRLKCPRCHAEEAGRLRRGTVSQANLLRDLNAA
jgi:phage FluMu protein Com